MNDENRPSNPPPPSSDESSAGAPGDPPPPPSGGQSTGGAPPPPPSGGGAQPGGTGGPGGGPASQNRGLMLVLSYLWVLALIPFLTEQEDEEVKWHARHGLVLLVAEVILGVVIFILSFVPAVGCIVSILSLLVWLGIIILHIVCLVKALNGERFTIPYVSDYVQQIP